MIKNVIFDHSGVLSNDYRAIFEAFRQTCAHFGGKEWDDEKCREKVSLDFPKIYGEAGVRAEHEEIQQVYRTKLDVLKKQFRATPGTAKLLTKLKKKRIGLAVISNAPQKYLAIELTDYKLQKYFSAVHGSVQKRNDKEYDHAIYLALCKLKAKPDETIFVGDMEEDIIAANRNKLVSVALSWKYSHNSRERLERNNPQHIITKLSELEKLIHS